MPFKKSVETYNRREENRRNLAELRVAYGNALSDSNLGRSVTPVTSMTSSSSSSSSCVQRGSCLPFGQLANSYSWQLSNTCSGKLMQRVTATDDNRINIVDEEPTSLRRYEVLQRQERLRNAFMQHLKQVKQKSGNSEYLTRKLRFSS